MDIKNKKREVLTAVIVALIKAGADMGEVGMSEALEAAHQTLKNHPHIQMHPRDLAQKIVNFGRVS